MLCLLMIQETPQVFVETMHLMETRYGAKDYIPVSSQKTLRPGTYFVTQVDKLYRRSYARFSGATKSEKLAVNGTNGYVHWVLGPSEVYKFKYDLELREGGNCVLFPCDWTRSCCHDGWAWWWCPSTHAYPCSMSYQKRWKECRFISNLSLQEVGYNHSFVEREITYYTEVNYLPLGWIDNMGPGIVLVVVPTSLLLYEACSDIQVLALNIFLHWVLSYWVFEKKSDWVSTRCLFLMLTRLPNMPYLSNRKAFSRVLLYVSDFVQGYKTWNLGKSNKVQSPTKNTFLVSKVDEANVDTSSSVEAFKH